MMIYNHNAHEKELRFARIPGKPRKHAMHEQVFLGRIESFSIRAVYAPPSAAGCASLSPLEYPIKARGTSENCERESEWGERIKQNDSFLNRSHTYRNHANYLPWNGYCSTGPSPLLTTCLSYTILTFASGTSAQRGLATGPETAAVPRDEDLDARDTRSPER